MPAPLEELTGTVAAVVWQSAESNWLIAKLDPPADTPHDPLQVRRPEGPTVLGTAPAGGLLAGQSYTFRGRWEYSEQYRKQQFRFDSCVERQSFTRHGVVQYLQRYAPYIGDKIAHDLVDRYTAALAIDTLKADPQRVARETRGLTAERATAAAEKLKEVQQFQETRVQLLDLLSKRGFGENAITRALEVWGVHAPQVIRRDPFKMMLQGVPGAGFLRCDQLWLKLGLPPDRMKRQVMAVWNHLRTDQSGSTWHSKAAVMQTVRTLVTGTLRPERAIAIAIRARKLTQTERDGQLWVADSQKARDEQELAAITERLIRCDDSP